MTVKTSDVRKYKPGTAEYVALHGQWRLSRGKRPSVRLPWERNPRKAFRIAKRFAYFPIGKDGKYLSGTVPASYTCYQCQAHGVKLWREYLAFNPKLLCASCAAANQGKDISGLRPDGKFPSKWGLTDQIGWYVPAVPCEDIDGWWGYTSVPSPGVGWWQSLPNFAD